MCCNPDRGGVNTAGLTALLRKVGLQDLPLVGGWELGFLESSYTVRTDESASWHLNLLSFWESGISAGARQTAYLTDPR